MHDTIPKRIIQTGKDSMQPLLDRAIVMNLRLLNPEYDYLFFDDRGVESFFDKEFPQYRTVFDSFRFPIQRYDFFRYLAVYRYGGFYFDLDVLLASDLDKLLTNGCVFPFEGLTFSRHLRKKYNMDWEIGNYAFGAAPGHPFLKAVIDNCIRAQVDPEWVKPMMSGSPCLLRNEYFVLNTTGPGLVTRTLAESPNFAKTVTVLFPDDVCDSRNWNCFGDVGVHQMNGSWRVKSNFLHRRLANYLESWRLKGLLKESLRQGPTRSHVTNTDFV